VFSVPPSWKVWQRRLKSHNFTAAQMERRLSEAETSLRFALQDQRLLFVINDDIEHAAADFAVLAFGRPLSSRQEADQARARTLVRNLLDHLELRRRDLEAPSDLQ